jgi:hypothetical protein
MRILMGFVFLTASGPLLAQNSTDVCAVDLDCRGALVCIQNACVPRPEEKKAVEGKPVSTPPLSRVEVALAAEVGVATREDSNVVSGDAYYGANFSAAYTTVPALALVLGVDFRYAHPSSAELDRYLSLSAGLRLQTTSRELAVDLLVGWTQFFIYQTIGGTATNQANDGTLLSLVVHYRVWGPLDVQAKLAENLFANALKTREFGIGVGVRL